MNLDLDKKVLSYALKDKKYVMELSNSVNSKYFHNNYQWLFNIIIGHFTNPKFKEIPSREIIIEQLSKDCSEDKLNNCIKIFDEVKNLTINPAEFSWHLDKLRTRYNNIVLNEHSKKIERIANSELDEQEKILKSNETLKETVVNVDAIYKKQIYKEGSIASSAKERFERYEGVEANPEIARGILTGFREFDRKTNGLHDGELMIVAGDTGCQPAGSKVLMADGTWKDIENIEIGDKIMSPQRSGQIIPVSVIKTFVFENKDIYRIISKGKKHKVSYRASHNHILPIIKPSYKNHKYIGNRYYEMSIDEYNNKSDAWKNKAKLITSHAYDLPEKKFEIDPYIVGIMLGDGSLSSNVNITSANEEIFNEFVKNGIFLGKDIRKIGGKASTRNILGECAKLFKSVIGSDKSHYKRVPKEYFLGSLNQRLELLAGLIDTDGTFEEFSSTSKQLAEDFRYLIFSIGGCASVNKRYTSCNGKKFLSYRVHYSTAEHKIPVRLKYKQVKDRNINWKNPRHRSFDVIPDGKGTVYGFSLGGDSQLYITDDFIITHNTGKSVLMHNIGVNAYLGSNNPLGSLEAIKDDGANVLYFSLEMPKESMERRLDSCMGELYYNQLRDGKLSEEDKRKYYNLIKFQMKYNKQFYIIDMPRGATVREIELKYIEICESFKPDLVIIDYMGIMRTSNGSGNENQDWLDLGHISAELHEFARAHNIPVITGSQVNRPKDSAKQEYSTNRLARSSMVPTNANIIVQIACRDNEDIRSDMEVFITKMRDGEKGGFTLSKDFGKMKIVDMVLEVSADDDDNEEEDVI